MYIRSIRTYAGVELSCSLLELKLGTLETRNKEGRAETVQGKPKSIQTSRVHTIEGEIARTLKEDCITCQYLYVTNQR
jgi:hypothetical protein